MNASQPQLRHHLGLAVGAALATWLAPLPAWAAATTCTASVINAPVLDPLGRSGATGHLHAGLPGHSHGQRPADRGLGFLLFGL
jgi:hypothetical protein